MRHFREINLYRIPVLCILVSFGTLYGISIREQNQAKSHMEVTVILVKAFTQNKDAGNPAGVILGADYLSYDQMFAIAQFLGFSESVFVTKSNRAQHRFTYFSPTQEVDACAHATIAAIHVIDPNDSITYETNLGLFEAFKDEDGMISLAQGSPDFIRTVRKQDIADCLGVEKEKLECDGHKVPWVVSTGVPKLLVPIQTRQDLFDIKPDFEKIAQYCEKIGARGIYVYTLDPIDPDHSAHARQFNPLSGINEDPVTGIAASALGSYFYLRNRKEAVYHIEQGDCLGKPGIIEVRVWPTGMYSCRVRVAGQAVIYGESVLAV